MRRLPRPNDLQRWRELVAELTDFVSFVRRTVQATQLPAISSSGVGSGLTVFVSVVRRLPKAPRMSNSEGWSGLKN